MLLQELQDRLQADGRITRPSLCGGRLASVFRDVPSWQAIVDGEVVVQDATGVSDFSALERALSEAEPKS